LGLWTSAAATRPRYGGTLRISFSQTAETGDPALAATLPERLLAQAAYETLVMLDEGGAAVPGLAAAWQSEGGGKRWVLQLRPGVRFHNSSLLNAAMVCSSLERSLAQARTAAAAQLRRLHFSCAAPAETRLVCELAEPLPALPRMLADRALAIADSDGAGTGPWKMVAFVAPGPPGQPPVTAAPRAGRARLEAFEDHWRGRPFLDAVEMELGSDVRRQRVDFEVRRADVLVTPTTEARPAANPRPTRPANLLVLGFHPDSPFLAAGSAWNKNS